MESTPVAQRGYARPELLTETDWLAAHVDDPRVRIIDARGPQQYAAAHIPGAVNLDGFGAGIPRAANADMAEPEQFSRIARELGIDNDMTVVVYDAPSQRMGMVAWTFLYYGHKDVRILDGGFDKWSREDRPTATDAVTYAPSTYTAHPVPDIYCSLEDAKAGQEQHDFVFWDTRAPGEYRGTVAGFGDPTAAHGAYPRCGPPGMDGAARPGHEDPEVSGRSAAPPGVARHHSTKTSRQLLPGRREGCTCRGGAQDPRVRVCEGLRRIVRAMVEPAGYAGRASLSKISAAASRRTVRPREEMSVTPVRPAA